MNTKKKNKNKPKPQKVPPKLEIEAPILENPDTNIKPEIPVDKSDAGVNVEIVSKEPDIPTENVSNVIPVTESEPPKRPKRAKGKKKEDTIAIEKSSEDKIELDVGVKDADLTPTENFENVVPRSRKKKNKNKKIIEDQSLFKDSVSGETEELIKIDKTTIDDAQNKDNAETLEQETKPSKKKKKKKNRNDSERSDKADDVPCTLAFKKLLECQDQGDSTKIIDDNSMGINVQEDNKEIGSTKESTAIDFLKESNKNEEIEEKTEPCNSNNKNSKKNKKNKQSKVDNTKEINHDISKTEIVKETDNLKVETSENTEVSLNIDKEKLKAKIIKPVEKKRKNKSETHGNQNIASAEKKPEESIDETNKVQSKQSSEILSSPRISTDTPIQIDIKEEIKKDELVDTVETPKLDIESTDIKQSITENVIEEKLQVLPENIPVEVEKIVDSKTDINDGFVEAKTQKKKKKRHEKIETATPTVSEIKQTSISPTVFQTKEPEEESSEIVITEKQLQSSENPMDSTKNVTHDVVLSEPERSEEQESVMHIPDLIQCPMSSSQQILDSNNNTIIEEISTPDEIKLGIPSYVGDPIIKGSGESPEVYSHKQPSMSFNVTEIENVSNKSVQEKTDLKSKMMEVNQDMEELRLSIERSLAELTAIEKSEECKEKQFEEKNIREQDDVIDTFNIKHDDDAVTDEKSKTLEKDVNILDSSEVKASEVEVKDTSNILSGQSDVPKQPEVFTTQNEPLCPTRKDNKGKSKSKKKNKQDATHSTTSSAPTSSQSANVSNESTGSSSSSKQETTKTEKSKADSSQTHEKGKQHALSEINDNKIDSTEDTTPIEDSCFEPIDNFEDALTSSVDDVNKTFEMIVNEIKTEPTQYHNNPQINIIAPAEDEPKHKKEKQNPVTKPKNLLGHPDIPVTSNKTDYKKEKNKLPNYRQATVKIKDSVEIEKSEKQSQTKLSKKEFLKNPKIVESFSYMTSENNEFIYKYSFRKVFLQSSCHVCKKDLTARVPCKFCSMIFYCSQKHMTDDWPRHQPLCFAVSTIAHLKDQKHIYADAKNITGQDYRILRMQMIVSCEKILKRKLEAWEQEALLYPRVCAEQACREWRQNKLEDCGGCGQISYCIDHPEHLPTSHQRWCKSYALYQKLVNHQQTKGRLEPPLPTKALEHYFIPDKINDLLASIYEEKIDMSDVEYAALTQVASAPLTAAYCHQLYCGKMNATCANGASKKSDFVVHAVGAELQYEADALNKWEIFFLHLRPDISDLRVVLVAIDLNPSNLPLDILGKFKLCGICRHKNRRVIFNFHDKINYHEYCLSQEFITPDIVCAFNQNIHRSSVLNGNDPWPSTINSILKQKVPFVLTSHTLEELRRDLARVKQCAKSEFAVVTEPNVNQFASVRPDRNFITDHEMPLQFKNYSYSILCGAF